MSGLEPLAALGLACNILQLVELGDRTIDLIKTIYQGRSPNDDLEQNAGVLETLSDEVKKVTGQSGGNNSEQALLNAAEKCSKAAEELREEIRFLIGNASKGSLLSALKVAKNVAWRKRRLERLKGNLDQAEKQMQRGLLAKIWSSTNAAELDLSGVRQDLRGFIGQYKKGHRQTIELVSSEGSKTREHISNEATRINQAVAQVDHKTDRIMFVQEAQVNTQARERFLQSLKYPALNERRNQVAPAYSKSLKWVFAGDNEDENDQDRGILDWEGSCRIQWDSFSNWLSSTNAIYWISGKPGSGKTTLVKYILNHERTRRYLDIWSPGCKIVSHYFWRPGSQLQKNLDGLFFSILHQLLCGSDTALKGVMSSVQVSKDSHTDWSRAELRSAIETALNAYEDGVFLFLDGIDEIQPQDESEPGIPEFLDWALELSLKERIKLCLASRPNPHILEMRLSKYPRLRLQDLNYQDLMAYAKGHIDVSNLRIDWKHEDRDLIGPIQLLVHKAEGVFLWLIIATKSINLGIENGDDSTLMRERIERIPKGLDSLYQDMWERAGADDPLQYRQTAALYFKILLQLQVTGHYLRSEDFNLLILMLATTSLVDGIFDALDDPSKLVRQDIMLRECQEVEKKMKLCCFGLIEVGPGIYKTEQLVMMSWYGRKYDRVFHLAYNRSLHFIHRTASDFLTETAMGAKVLAFDKTSEYTIHYRLLKAQLATGVLYAVHAMSSSIWDVALEEFQELWEGTKEWASEGSDPLMLVCEKLANFGRLFIYTGEGYVPLARVQFLNTVIHRAFNDGLVISRVKTGGLSTNEKSEILLNFSNRRLHTTGWMASDVGTLRDLLGAGADPNWQGWTQLRGWLRSATLYTPWQQYLLNTFTWEPWPWTKMEASGIISQADIILQLTSLFITEGARLDEMVNMAIRSGPHDNGFVVDGIELIRGHGNERNYVIASIPAYMIVEVLIEMIRHRLSKIDNSVKSEEALRQCQSLERACFNHHGDRICHVKGLLTLKRLWCEPVDDMQTQCADILKEWMEMRVVWLKASPIERAMVPMANGKDFEDTNTGVFNSLRNNIVWGPKVEGTYNVIFKRFKELGLVVDLDAQVRSGRPVKEWVRKYNEENQSK